MYGNIKEQFKSVIRYSQGIDDPKVDKLFEIWKESKKHYIELFGGLIYEWPEQIEFSLDPKEKRDKAMQFSNRVYSLYHNEELSKFLDANLDSFFDNKVISDEGKQIPKGMKLIKAFKYFEKDKSVLVKIQDMASQYIQENKIKGTLCFSVHPLDFLSSSENNYKWRSCHSLDGEFRAGNLSYMVDRTTFMVYLKGKDDEILPNFPGNVPWNSKKWRMLFHEQPDHSLIFAGRQYPFSSESGITTVLNIYNNLLQQCESLRPRWSWGTGPKYDNWTKQYIDNFYGTSLRQRYLMIDRELVDIEYIVKEGTGALNYNDVLHSSCYLYPYYATPNEMCECYHSMEHMLKNPIEVGGRVPCLHCEMDEIEDSGYMRCSDCEYRYGDGDDDCYTYCSCCDSRIYVDDCYYVNDEPVCDSCADTECFRCDHCGDLAFNEECHTVKIGEGDQAVTNCFCQWCYQEYEDEKEGKE